MVHQLDKGTVLIAYAGYFLLQSVMSLFLTSTKKTPNGLEAVGPVIYVKSWFFKALYRFPSGLSIKFRDQNKRKKVRRKKKEEPFGLIGVVMYWITYVLMLATCAMLVLPDYPCAPVEVFVLSKRRLSSADYIADTLNEKLPLLWGMMFCLAQMLFVLFYVVLKLCRSKELRKDIQFKYWALLIFCILLFLVMFLYCASLIFVN